MEEEGLSFRATKDLDIVLIVEALDAGFEKKFWECAKMAGYERWNKSASQPEFYRFSHPSGPFYPTMIELFSRKPGFIALPKEARLAPLPLEEGASSLSAILLDEAYYVFLKEGKTTVDGVSILDEAHLIPFKAKAWLDLSERKAKGEQIDEKNIRKHKNDIFRLSQLLVSETRIACSQTIYEDMHNFAEKMESEDVDLKQLGIAKKSKQELLSEILSIYEASSHA